MLWKRLEDDVIELSLKVSSGDPNMRRWRMRLEGNRMELCLVSDEGLTQEKYVLERTSPSSASLKVGHE